MITISVIGTAGRKEDGPKLNTQVYQKMYDHLLSFLTNMREQNRLEKIILKSGGAAMADHLAVKAFLDHTELVDQLILYFPCKFNTDFGQFYSPFDADKTARIANYYHTEMNKLYLATGELTPKIPFSCLDLVSAIRVGAIVNDTHKGFFDRNNAVGVCDYMLAYTFNDAPIPKDGGTLNCWKHSKCLNKIHIDIGKL